MKSFFIYLQTTIFSLFNGFLRLAQYKYNQLLLTLIILFLVNPFLGDSQLGNFCINLFFLFIILLIIKTILKQKAFIIYFAIAILAFVSLDSEVLTYIEGVGRSASQITYPTIINFTLIILGTLIDVFFLGIPIYLITKEIFLEDKVKLDTIKGGICVYLLLGFLWAILYTAIYRIEKTGFSLACQDCQPDFFYFSFTTLTTTGYGDIVPVNKIARTLSSLESVAGVIYPTIFIARLVGLYSNEQRKTDV